MNGMTNLDGTLNQFKSQMQEQQAAITKQQAAITKQLQADSSQGMDPKGFETARSDCQGGSEGCDESCQLTACDEACTTFGDTDSCSRRDTLACLGHKNGCDEICQLAACSAACKAGASEACEQRKKIMGE